MNVQHVIKLSGQVHEIKQVNPISIRTTSGLLFFPASNKIVQRQWTTGQFRTTINR